MNPAARPVHLLGGTLVTLALALASVATSAGLPDTRFLTDPSRPTLPTARAVFGGDLGTATLSSGPTLARAGGALTDRVARPASVNAVAGWSFESNLAGQTLGMSLTPLGDVNGDGYSDFAARGNMPFNTSLYLFFGGPGGPTLAAGYPVTNLPPGAALAAAGDVNGDGFDDLALLWYSTGSIKVYFGTATGLDLAHPNSVASLGTNLLGFNAAPAGDVNGDGFGDFVVGMPGVSGGFPCTPLAGSGEVVVYYGSATGISDARLWFATGCYSVGVNAGVGTSVAGAGDVNGDGYDDIIVGAPGAEASGVGVTGKAFVMYGSAAGFPLVNGFSNFGSLTFGTAITGQHLFATFGNSVAPAGDLNGDGYADVAVGAPYDDNYGTDAGMAFVFPGSASGVDTLSAHELWSEAGPAPNARFGSTLAPAGDVNGDGRPDLLIGEVSRVDLAQGSGGTLIIQQSLGYPTASTYVMTAGDVNADGLSDLLVGDPNYSNGEASEGRVLVHYGVGTGPATFTNWSVTQTAIDNPNLGWSVASAGDVNADGFDDVLVGEPTWYNFTSPGDSNNGIVQLYYGHANGLSTASDWYYYGASGDQVGISVASADVNGDGYSDIVVGAHTAAGGLGQVRVWYGSAAGPSPGGPSVTINGFSAGSQFGASVAAAGDVDGDGYPDIIVGAPYGVDPTSPLSGEGRAYVFRGGAGGLNPTPYWSHSGGQADAHFGYSVAGAGDVNGDGFSDVVVGSPDFDTTNKFGAAVVDAGRAQVFFGSPAGPAAVTQVSVVSAGWRFGNAVAGAGDVNGDGYSDIVVGSPGGVSTLTGEGNARVYTGGPGGTLGLLWNQFGGEALGAFGSSVSSAGDVDGDGLSDVMVGAVFQDLGGPTDQGSASIFRGPLTAGAPAFWIATGGASFANMGHSLANAGDVNADGWSDLIFGEPGYNGLGYRQGYCQVRYGAGSDGKLQLGVGYHITAPAHIMQPGCLSDPGALFLLSTGRSAAGRTKVRLQYRVTPIVGLPAPGLSGLTAYTATGAPGANGSIVGLSAGGSGLTNGVPYAWTMRTLSHSVYFPTGPWRSPVRSGRLETDFRVPGTWLAVEDRPAVARLLLADARPNPMRNATSIGFDLTRPGPVSLEILDVQGRRVRSLARGIQAAGPHRLDWDGRGEDGAPVGAGIYFVHLEAEGQMLSRKLARLR